MPGEERLKLPAFQDWSDTASDQDSVRVVYYVRQSHKNETDSMSSPLAQARSCEAYIQSQPGWKLVKPGGFSDIGISGYDPNAYRPGYEEMMQWVNDGKVDVVVIFALSRLTRQGAREALRIHGVMQEKGVALVSTTEPFINTAHDNPFSVAFFALIAALAEQESKNKSEFITNAFKELKERGSHSSGVVPWWAEAEQVNVDGVTIRRLKPHSEKERVALAMRIIEMAEGTPDEPAKAGNAIANTLSDEGVPVPAKWNGNLTKSLEAAAKRRKGAATDHEPQWDSNVVLRFLRDPRIAGFAIEAGRGKNSNKTLKRAILRDADGNPVAPHTGLIAPARWFALQEVLDGNKRERKPQRNGGEMTLLGSWGISDCGLCGSGMTVARAGMGAYVCNLRRRVGEVDRHTVKVPMPEADRVVAQMVWTRLMALDMRNEDDAALVAEAARRFAHNNANPEVEAERLAVKAQLAHVRGSIKQTIEDRDLYKGRTGRALWAEQMEKLAAHEESCEARLKELEESLTTTQTLPFEAWTGGYEDPLDEEAPWSQWTIEERRGFLALWIDKVHIAPAPERIPGQFNTRDPEAVFKRTLNRITVDWAKAPVRDEEPVA